MIYTFAFILPDPEHSRMMRAVLVLGYLAASLFWFKAGLQSRTVHEKSSERWWMLGALLLVLLAMNKAFDFRTHCETFLRLLAQTTGWYERRQPVQLILALILPVAAGLFVLKFLRTDARQFVREHPLALPGWFLLLLYPALRQAQEWKPAFDWLVSFNYHQWRLVVETAGIALVSRAAAAGWKENTPKC